jgi:hypothetical protein
VISSSREWVMVRTGREGLGPGVFHWAMRGRCIDIVELRMRSGSAGEGVCCGARWPVGAVQCCCRVRLKAITYTSQARFGVAAVYLESSDIRHVGLNVLTRCGVRSLSDQPRHP